MCVRKTVAVLLTVALSVLSLPVGVSALSPEELTAPSAVLMEPTTGKVLFEKNPHEVRACASITKVMTLMLIFEAINSGKIAYTDTVVTSEHASSMGGSDIWLEPNETMTVDEMIKAVVVASANDAAVALAEHISGSEDDFVAAMNDRAKELGMNETVFKNCNGLDEDGHVTSAYDVALMSAELIKHEKIFEYSSIWLDYLRDGQTQIVNTNKLLKSYKGITGLKTGTTGDAGSCMSATAQRNGLSLVAVVLGCETGTSRFSDAAKLLDYGFANYQVTQLKLPQGCLDSIPVKGGMDDSVGVSCKVRDSVILPKGGNKTPDAVFVREPELTAPVSPGTTVGKLTYSLDGATVDEFDIVTSGSVDKLTFGTCYSFMFGKLFSL